MFFPVSLSKIIIFANILLLLSISAVGAAEEEIEDYSKGFEVFYKLGLPDVSNAEYVNFYNRTLDNWGSFILKYAGISGNAWQIEENRDGSGQFIFANAIPINADNMESGNDKRRYLFQAAWNEVSLVDDIQRLIFGLQKMDRGSFPEIGAVFGPIFLYAIQIHKKGFKKEANQIISRIFEISGDRNAVLILAMNSLAEQQYLGSLIELKESGDWKKFEAALNTLIKRYPKGWWSAPGINLLHEMVQKQIANPASLEPEGISEEDKKLVSKLANLKELSSNTKKRSIVAKWIEAADEKVESPFWEIVGQGKRSIPILIALLKNDYMLTICEEKNYSYYRKGGDQSQADVCLSGIPHPVKIKDVAKMILLDVLIPQGTDKELDLEEIDDKIFATICRRWYDKIKTKSKDELLLDYLKDGNEDQQNAVLTMMIRNYAEKHSSSIESFILKMEKNRLEDILNLLPEYVAKRRKAAGPFLEKLKEKFEDEFQKAEKYEKMREEEKYLEDNEGEYSPYTLSTIKRNKRILDELSYLLDGKSAKQIIDEVISGENNLYGRRIFSELMVVDEDEAIGVLLYGALNAKNAYVKKAFINKITQLIRMKDGNKKLSIEKNAEAWRKLLEDKTECLITTTVNIDAAITIDDIYGGTERRYESIMLRNELGERADSFLLTRAKERLAGKTGEELTPYPKIKDIDNVAKENVEEGLANAIKEKNLEAFIKSLSNNEFAVLPRIISKTSALNAGLKNYANRIIRVKCYLKGEEEKLDYLKDAILDKTVVEKIQEYCKELASHNRQFVCMINRVPAFGGVSIFICNTDELEGVFGRIIKTDKKKDEQPRFMSGSISNISNSGLMKWDILNGEKDEITVDGKKIKLEYNDDTEWEASLKGIFSDSSLCNRRLSIQYRYMSSTAED